MDFYQGVIADYLSASRSIFFTGEFCLTLPSVKNGFWVDFVAVSFKEQCTYLCEVTYSKRLLKITQKVEHYGRLDDEIRSALQTLANVPQAWPIKVWLFVPRKHGPALVEKLKSNHRVRITYLEDVGPWSYPNGHWPSNGEPGKPYPEIPSSFQ